MSTDWIRRWDRFEELQSTSTHLAQIWRSGQLDADETPIVVTTQRQTAGRGRGDHQWFSDHGSLTFTLGISPQALGLSLVELVPVGLLTACSMISAIESLWPSIAGQLGVRWPNDIECDHGKVGGILPECIIKGGNDLLLLIGVGVNVTTDLANGPPEARSIGTAIGNLVSPYDFVERPLDSLLQAFLQHFRKGLGRLSDPTNAWITEASPYDRLMNQPVKARQGHDFIEGLAQGWDNTGRLLILQASGEIVPISSGQILRSLP